MGEKEVSMLIIGDESNAPKDISLADSTPIDISISFRTSDAQKGMKKIKELNPGLVFVELNRIEEEPTPFLLKLKHSYPNMNVIVQTEKYALGEWLQLLKSGAKGILEGDISGSELSAATRVVLQGGIFISPNRVEQFLDQCATKVHQAEEKAGDLLTDREIQVLKVLAEGFTVKKAAEILDLSPKTVDTHKANLMRKINIHHRADLIKYALRKKIITLQED